MIYTALVRTAMILTQSWAYDVALTPPNPPPPPTEQKKHTDTMPLSVYWMAKIWKSLFYSTALVEVLAVAVTELPLEEYAAHLHLTGAVPLIHYTRRFTGAGSMSLYISPESVVGWCMAIGGTLLRVWCYKTLAKAFTFEPSVKEGHELVRSGPYKYVRHPSYTGFYSLMIGAAMLTYGRGSWWASVGFGLGVWKVLAMAHLSWQAILASSFWGRCDLEDKVLHDHFKEQWEQWAQDVPCKVIPGVI